MSTNAESYQWRLYVGPRLYRTGDPYYYDWTKLRTASYNSVLTSGATNASATQIQLNNSTTLPAAGGVWIRPFSDPQPSDRIEFVEYALLSSARLQTLRRTQPVAHTNGSQVVVLWLLEHDDGAAIESRTLDSDLAVSSWSIKISGFRVPNNVTLTGHLCRLQTRHLVGNQWEAWQNKWIGVISQVQKDDDRRRAGRWTLTITPPVENYGANEVAGIRAGDLDIAQNSTATGTTPLQVAYKEQGSGDFTASNPTFSAQNVLDADSKKIYITDRFFGEPSNKPVDANGNQWLPVNDTARDVFVSQAYLNPPPGYVGTRWIEITTYLTSLTNLILVIPGGQYMITGSSIAHTEPGDHIILAENRDIFERENPDHEARVVTKMEDRAAGVNIFDYLSATQGGIALFGASSRTHNSVVLWGGQPYNLSGGFGDSPAGLNLTYLRPWNGPTKGTIGTGQTIRYIYNPSGNKTLSGTYWTVDNISTPGYNLPGHLGSGNIHGPPPHLIFSLPGIGLEVANDIAAGVSFIPMRDGSGAATTNGIPASGTIQIGTRQYTYTSKTESGVNLAGVTAQTHDEGDIVYVLQNGAITDGYPIDHIKLTPTAGGIRPTNMALYVSPHPGGARPPTVGDWQSDYPLTWQGNWATTNGVINIATGYQRARTMILWLYNSNSEPARARLARAQFDVDKDEYGGYGWIDDGPAETLVQAVLGDAGMDTAAITITSSLATLGDAQSASTSAWAVITDAVQRHMGRLNVQRNGQITIATNTFWTDSTYHESARTFDETNTSSVRLQSNPARRISQVELEWEDNSGATGTERSPLTAADFGVTRKFGPLRLISGGYAPTIAANLFNIYAYPVQASVECIGAYEDLEVGEIVRIVWDFEEYNQTHDYRYVVVEVEHSIKKGVWGTKFNAWRIDSQEPG